MYKDRKACEYVLRIIMDDEELTVIDNEVQMDFKNMPDRPYWSDNKRKWKSFAMKQEWTRRKM